MRTGLRLLLSSLLLLVVLCAPARAADSLGVIVDNSKIAQGDTTTLAAHVETDAGYGGGHVAFKYKPSTQDCAGTPTDDTGTDASGTMPVPVSAGPGVSDVGGQMIELDTGDWRICGWLVDDSTGSTVAVGSTIVTVLPYEGSIDTLVRSGKRSVQVTLSFTTSAPARLYSWIQPASRSCAKTPARIPSSAVLLVPRLGRLVGSDGGLGAQVGVKVLAPGRWRVCSLLVADSGGAGPATKSFAVRRPHSSRRGVRVAG